MLKIDGSPWISVATGGSFFILGNHAIELLHVVPFAAFAFPLALPPPSLPLSLLSPLSCFVFAAVTDSAAATFTVNINVAITAPALLSS
jgi:hypothetical protein